MSPFRLFTLCVVLCAAMAVGQSEVTTQKPVTIDLSSSPAPDVSSPVPEKTTTKKSTTTTTTEAPTTTTEEPSTTTEAPTTSTEPPKPTPAPVPPTPASLPPPEQGTWVFEEKNVTCIVVQFAAQLNVTYSKSVANVTSLAYIIFNVPANASVTGGNCTANDTQFLTISWTANNTVTPNNMTLTFKRNDTTKNYALSSLNVSLTNKIFPNASSNNSMELSHGPEWQTPIATSYRCMTPTRLNMTAESESTVAALTLSRLQEEAFRSAQGKGFSVARECGGGDVPDAVPIAVGCALGGLVVVVLVAYLVARRRSAARGYLSM